MRTKMYIWLVNEENYIPILLYDIICVLLFFIFSFSLALFQRLPPQCPISFRSVYTAQFNSPSASLRRFILWIHSHALRYIRWQFQLYNSISCTVCTYLCSSPYPHEMKWNSPLYNITSQNIYIWCSAKNETEPVTTHNTHYIAI